MRISPYVATDMERVAPSVMKQSGTKSVGVEAHHGIPSHRFDSHKYSNVFITVF